MGDYSKTNINPQMTANGSVWDKSSLYKTSTHHQNEKNVLAMNNSTEQLLKTKSNNLFATSINKDSINQPIVVENLKIYDHSNQFKTSYHLMGNIPPQHQSYFLPKYSGFVPGMKSENPFGNSFTKASCDQMALFDMRQHNKEAKESMYKPISKTIGSFFKNGAGCNSQNEPYDPTKSQSGYSINLLAKSPAGIICPSFIEPLENNKTEYRSNFNQKRNIHYKGPLFSTGILKQPQTKPYLL